MLNSRGLNQGLLNGSIASNGGASVVPSTPAGGLRIQAKVETISVFGDAKTVRAFGDVQSPKIRTKVE